MKHWSRICIAALTFVAASAWAHHFELGPLDIQHPWARATAPAAKTAGVFLKVKNAGKEDDVLVKAETDVAGKVALHSMEMANGMMKMREVASMPVSAGSELALEPGHLHVMLFDLKRPLKEGELFPLTLTFAKAGKVVVQVKVEAMTAAPSSEHEHH